MRATQLIVWFALVLCLDESLGGVAHGKECGDNPMKQVLLVAKRTGRTLGHVLTVLQEIDGPAYDTLAQKFRLYAACVGLVDTGYFRRRRSGSSTPWDRTPTVSGDQASRPTDPSEKSGLVLMIPHVLEQLEKLAQMEENKERALQQQKQLSTNSEHLWNKMFSPAPGHQALPFSRSEALKFANTLKAAQTKTRPAPFPLTLQDLFGQNDKHGVTIDIETGSDVDKRQKEDEEAIEQTHYSMY